jgi:hypothetical protein
VVALGTPTERQKSQWYFQRYVSELPAAGEIVLFDRSWYNRAGVERVMEFCSDAEYWDFLRSAPAFERMLVRSGITIIKYWFSVSDEEQERRFRDRVEYPIKRWPRKKQSPSTCCECPVHTEPGDDPKYNGVLCCIALGESTPGLSPIARTKYRVHVPNQRHGLALDCRDVRDSRGLEGEAC